VLDTSGKDAAAKRLLDQALAANISYLDRISVAASGLTAVRASAAVTAEAQVVQSYSMLSASVPGLTVLSNAIFASASQLQTLAAAQENAAQAQATATQAKAASTAALRTYVRSIDSLLQNSADTRSNLGALIGDIQNGQLSASGAASEISSIINQRQDLQNQVSAVATPTTFRVAAAKLRDSIAASLQDDYAIQGWINAWYDNEPTPSTAPTPSTSKRPRKRARRRATSSPSTTSCVHSTCTCKRSTSATNRTAVQQHHGCTGYRRSRHKRDASRRARFRANVGRCLLRELSPDRKTRHPRSSIRAQYGALSQLP